MNFVLDRLVRRIARDPSLLDELAGEAKAAGLDKGDLRLLLAKDLAGLRERGVPPLLLMHLAGALRIEPMAALGRRR